MYVIANANESTTFGSGDTKKEALTDALHNFRCESYSNDEYESKKDGLLDDLKNSELFQDAYEEWAHYKKL